LLFSSGPKKLADRDAAAAGDQIEPLDAELGMGFSGRVAPTGLSTHSTTWPRWLTRRTRNSECVTEISSVALASRIDPTADQLVRRCDAHPAKSTGFWCHGAIRGSRPRGVLPILRCAPEPVSAFRRCDVSTGHLVRSRINFATPKRPRKISVTHSELRVRRVPRRVSHRGHVVEWVLNPLWVQLDQKNPCRVRIERLLFWSPAAAASRSPAFWDLTKKQALPKP